MDRRSFAYTLCGAITATTGCLGRFGQTTSTVDRNRVGVSIRNDTSKDRRVTITVKPETGDAVFNERYRVPAGEFVEESSVFEATEDVYYVTVSVDGIGSRTSKWGMSGCTTNTILVRVRDDIWINEKCSAE